MTLKIGKLFLLKVAHPKGCHKCGRILFEDDQVGYVDGELVCNDPCIAQIKANDPIYSRVGMFEKGK